MTVTSVSNWFANRAPLAALGLVGAVALAAPTPAEAQFTVHPMACEARVSMVDKLKSQYGETRRGAGLQSDTGIVELYVADDGSWTLLLTLPNGQSCPVAVGEAWEDDRDALKGLDQPV